MNTYKKILITLFSLIIIGLIIVVILKFLPRSKKIEPITIPGTTVSENQKEITYVSLDTLIPCAAAVGITTDTSSGLLSSQKTTNFAEYDIHLEQGTHVPQPAASIIASSINGGLCGFEKLYNDTAISSEDKKMLGFLNPDESLQVRYNYTVSMKPVLVGQWGTIDYIVNSYEFTGGAHGMGTIKSVLFDTKNNQVVTGAELFDTAKLDMLRLIVKQKLQLTLSDSGMINDEMLQVGIQDTNTLLGIVIPTETGINLQFQSYDVAPYAAGQPTISLSFDELKSLLTQTWKDRLGLE